LEGKGDKGRSYNKLKFNEPQDGRTTREGKKGVKGSVIQDRPGDESTDQTPTGAYPSQVLARGGEREGNDTIPFVKGPWKCAVEDEVPFLVTMKKKNNTKGKERVMRNELPQGKRQERFRVGAKQNRSSTLRQVKRE